MVNFSHEGIRGAYAIDQNVNDVGFVPQSIQIVNISIGVGIYMDK